MADTFIAVPDLLSLLELAINAEHRFGAQPRSCWAGTPSISSRALTAERKNAA
jgi:hypothetical protein